MPESEAKKNFELLERCYRASKNGTALHEVLIEFVTLEDLVEAIKALEEIQQFRAIGTVEELQEIGSVKQIKDTMVKLQTVIHKLTKYLREWESIGSMEEFKSYKNGYCMNDCEHYDNCANYIYSKGYNKAVDDFAEKICVYGTYDYLGNVIDILEIAEKMKGDATDES